MKRSAVVLMKENSASTALVGAIAGTTAKTLDRVYDAPTCRRQRFHPGGDRFATRGPRCSRRGGGPVGEVMHVVRPSPRRRAV
eukprot:8430933-Lingulodinium_polyedra.AAC.1